MMGVDLYMMLIQESHVFKLWIDTKFEVCFFCSFFFETLEIDIKQLCDGLDTRHTNPQVRKVH